MGLAVVPLPSSAVFTRRVFLAGVGSAVVLSACGSSDDGDATGGPGSESPITAAPGERVLGAGFADGYGSPSSLVAGIAQRAPLVLFDGIGVPVREGGPDSFEVTIRQGATTVSTTTVLRHDAGIPTPYYPLVFTPPVAGDYEAFTELSERAMPFRVGEPSDAGLIQVGDKLRPVDTPTTANARGVNPICTRSPEPCAFHDQTLTEAMALGKPLVFIVSTPGFCQTAICGPVLEILVDVAPNYPDLQVVHAEVYVDPNKLGANVETTEAVDTYAMTFEPSLVVTDATGTVTARLDFTWDRAELTAALDQIG